MSGSKLSGGRVLRAGVLALTVFVFSLIFQAHSDAKAAETTVFGPNQYTRTSGSPDVFTASFTAAPGSATIIVKNGSKLGGRRVENSVSSARVMVNGAEIFGPKDFGKNVYYLEQTISLIEQNVISIQIASTPGSYITVEAVQAVTNSQPVAHPQAVTTRENTSIPIILTGSDPDGDPLTYRLISEPGHGSLSGTAPNCTYSPAAGFHGTDSFVFIVSDGILDSDPATVAIEVAAVNNPPAANDDRATTDENVPVTINVIENDVDVDGDALVVSGFTQAANGTVTDNADGSLTYTPNPGYSGTDGFTYTVSDKKGGTGTAAVYITITKVTQVPSVGITADPSTIVAGESSTLAWTSAHADTLEIDNGIGAVGLSGSASVSPSSTTTYTITATGPGGTAADSVEIIVYQVPTVSITATPNQIVSGESATLSWTSANAQSVSIDNGIGEVSFEGSLAVSPSATTTFTITAAGRAGTVSDSVTLSVIPPPITITTPGNGARIERPDAMVVGTIDSSFGDEVGIVVNDIQAAVYGSTFVANHVPLYDGENAIVVRASNAQGNTAQSEVFVHADIARPCITLEAGESSGVSVFEAVLTVDSLFSSENQTVTYTGPGQVQFLESTDEKEYRIRVADEGVYFFTVEVADGTAVYRDTVGIVVHSEAEIDALLRSKWEDMRTALSRNDIGAAVKDFSSATKTAYANAFGIMTQEQRAEFVQELGTIRFIKMMENVAEYDVLTTRDGKEYSFYLTFEKGGDGLWKIRAF